MDPLNDPIPIPDAGDDAGRFATQAAWDLPGIGTCLAGSYRLIRRLAQGGMADIYLASHERLSGLFAVKVPSPVLACFPDGLPRFQQEAAVMTTIRHPNVVQVVDFDVTSQGMPYMVMEYLDGQDLACVRMERFLTPAEISRIVRKVACGLDAAHRLGIVHRDLKPENIMIVPCEGQPDVIKVIDFGVCKARRFGHMTGASTLIGTPDFMSPEQALGNHDEVDGRSDQFALAVVSYLLLTGHSPWGTTEPIQILGRIVNDGPLPLRAYIASSCDNVESVLFRGMARMPDHRYPSTLIFAHALNRALIMDGLLPEHVAPGGLEGIESLESPSPIPVNTDELDTDQNRADPVAPTDSVPPPLPTHVADAPVRLPASARCAARDKLHARRRGLYVWRGTILLIAFLCGGSLGFLDAPTVRAQTLQKWNAVQEFVTTTVTQSTRAAERGFSKAWQTGVDSFATTARN